VTVEGEIAELTLHRSGHWYFTLKDQDAQLRVAMFRFQNQHVSQPPKEGDQVLLTGKLSIYAPRGSYQFVATTLEAAGVGKLLRQFEALKAELQALGWFSDYAKQAIDQHNKTIAVITSPQAAAFADIRTTFARRNPSIELILIPVAVQGEQSAASIVNAIQTANQLHHDDFLQLDAILLARGGGSIEDLWSFNERIVAEAIFHSQLPIVSAVGHESDVTIADLVADLRAATPTAAAELLSGDINDIQQSLSEKKYALIRAIKNKLEKNQLQLRHLEKRLKHPSHLLAMQAQRLDLLDTRLNTVVNTLLQKQKTRFKIAYSKLNSKTPEHLLLNKHQSLESLQERLQSLTLSLLQHYQQRFAKLSSNLHLVSPLATLERGYSLTTLESGEVISDIDTIKKGEKLVTRLHQGTIYSTVDTTKKDVT